MSFLRDFRIGKASGILAFVALFSLPLATASAQQCDRDCLGGLITQYVDALVAREPSRLPLADEVRFTEDSAELELGQGIWKSITGKGDFRHDYLDTAKQIAASHVVLLEGTNQILYSVLLYVQDRRITGIETLVQRITPASRFQPTELGKPVRGLDDPVPAGKRQSRASMIETALGYAEGLRIGSFSDATRFAPETYRVENGVITAGEGCGRADCGMYTQRVIVHPGIIASVAAVDEQNGVVLLWMNFGFTDSYGAGNALVTFEAFKVWGDEIHAINAFFRTMPLATPRYWPSSDPQPRGPDSGITRLLDRQAIEELLAGKYPHALDARDFDAYAALFTEDGELSLQGNTAKGRAAIKAFVSALPAEPRVIHPISNLSYEITGDTATGGAYWQDIGLVNGVPGVLVAGRYEDTLRKVDGEWRIAKRDIIIEFAPPAPAQ